MSPGSASLVLLTMVLLNGTGCLPGAIGTHYIFETKRHPIRSVPQVPYENVTFEGERVVIRGWLFRTTEVRNGTVVYLHGRNHNREEALPVVARLLAQGYDVLAYDSRAHGESTGTYSTFGYLEKRDLSRALDYLGVDHAIVMGVSLGGAVALQAAAEDPRISGVIAVASFASLQQIVRDQVPWIVPSSFVRGTLRNTEGTVGVRASAVDTVRAAQRVFIPVLLLHGDADSFTSPSHSSAIYGALGGPRELVLISGARHNDVLAREQAWRAIRSWLSDRRSRDWSQLIDATPDARCAPGPWRDACARAPRAL